MNVKVTYFFKAASKAGWTEGFYVVADDLTFAMDKVSGGYVTNRLKCLHPEYYLKEIRVSDDSPLVRGDSLVKYYTPSTGAGTFAPGTGQPTGAEQPYDRLKCSLRQGATKRRSIDLGGLPQGQITADSNYQPTPNFLIAMNALTTSMLAAPAWSIKSGGLGPQTFPLTMVADASGRTLALTYAGALPAGFVSNAKVNVRLVLGGTGYNGMWRIAYTNGLTVTLYPRPSSKIFGANTTNGIVSLVTYTYPAINIFIPIEGVKRDTGRPSDVLVGRRKRRAG